MPVWVFFFFNSFWKGALKGTLQLGQKASVSEQTQLATGDVLEVGSRGMVNMLQSLGLLGHCQKCAWGSWSLKEAQVLRESRPVTSEDPSTPCRPLASFCHQPQRHRLTPPRNSSTGKLSAGTHSPLS